MNDVREIVFSVVMRGDIDHIIGSIDDMMVQCHYDALEATSFDIYEVKGE